MNNAFACVTMRKYQGQGVYLKRKLHYNVKNRPVPTSVHRMNKSPHKYFNGLKIQSKRTIPQGG